MATIAKIPLGDWIKTDQGYYRIVQVCSDNVILDDLSPWSTSCRVIEASSSPSEAQPELEWKPLFQRRY